MIQNFRKSLEGTTAKVIVGLIIVTFALFGVDSIVGGLSGEPSVAEVNGAEIPESEYKLAVERKKRQVLSQLGENADPDLIDDALIGASVLDGMIKTEVVYQDAEQKGLFVSDEMINQFITQNDSFKVDGKFSNEHLQLVLRSNGLTVKDFKSALTKDYMVNQPRSAIMASAFLLEDERDRLIQLDRQVRTYGAAVVKAATYHDQISISDEAVVDHYNANKTSYPKPESVDVSYVELNKNSFVDDVKVDEAALLKMYEAEKENYEPEEKRDASHILVKVGGDRSEADALKLINEISDKVKAGEDFSELAKLHSEDDGSASKGGNLGPASKGVYVDAFEDALYGLQLNQVSAPVKTEFGYHLIKLVAVDRDDVPTFESMRTALEQRYIQEAVAKEYVSQVEKLSDLSYSASDLSEPAEMLGLEIKSLAGVSADSSDVIFSNPKVQKRLFSDELITKGDNSEVIEIGEGRSIVFRVDAHHEAGVYAVDAVREKIRNELIEQKAKEFATSVGQAFYSRLSAGELPEVVAKEMGLSWAVHKDVRRDNYSLDNELLKRVFAMTDAADVSVRSFVLPSGDFAVVKLDAVNRESDEGITIFEKQSIASMLGRSLGAIDYDAYENIAMRISVVDRL